MGIIKKIIWGVCLFLLLVIGLSYGMHCMWVKTHACDTCKNTEDIFQNLAVSIIISWVVFLIAYYIWAILFYNVNLGWTDEDWEKQEEVKNVNPRAVTEEPGSPNPGESLGLPAGTVRATIALSLLVAGLAMTIASLSMNNTYPANSLFIDHFEFFKTAFIMMIAFYFGSKSLEIIRDSNKKSDAASQKSEPPASPPDPSPAPDPVIAPEAGTLHDPEAKG